MAKIRLAMPGLLAALTLGAALATTAVAQAPRAPEPGAGPQAPQRGAQSRDLDDDDQAGGFLRELEEYAEGRGGRRWGPGGPGGRRGGRGGMMFGGLCGPDGGQIAARMLTRLERVTAPTEAQRPGFDKLKGAAEKAAETARAGCPAERSATPTGRLAAAEKRLAAMLDAIRILRPAFDEYFGSLNEEQKARFYSAGGPRRGRMGPGGPDGGRGGWRGPRERERWREERRRMRDGDRGDMRPGSRHGRVNDWPRDWGGPS
ncbi:MAG: Spy/CpxP family protein refolding chaperone [Variibacter sp.]|nr:Spy/CpxP family protein refolding chaperone [Variibacter sp.]